MISSSRDERCATCHAQLYYTIEIGYTHNKPKEWRPKGRAAKPQRPIDVPKRFVADAKGNLIRNPDIITKEDYREHRRGRKAKRVNA